MTRDHACRGGAADVRARCALLALIALPALSGAQAPAPPPPDPRPAIVTQGVIDPRRDVNFAAIVVPSRVYVGQQVTYQIGVFLSEDVAQRLRRNPEFVPPDVRSMLAYDLASPTRPLPREAGGRRYDVHVFQRALFPLTAGTHRLAPARLTYALPLSNSFFSREETHAARTGALTIIARDPPTAGRPADFSGAVGRISISARVDTVSARVGDPVTLVVRVQGTGNVPLFPRPALAVPWGDAVSGAERVSIDSGLPLVQGRKDFEWIVTPKREGTVSVPAVRYPYWNPYSEQYEIALSQPLALHVGRGALAATVTEPADSTPRLPLRAAYRGALRRPVATSPALWAVLALVPLPSLVLAARRRPRRGRPRSSAEPLRRLADTPGASAADVRRAFTVAVMQRTAIGASDLADARRMARALRLTGVSTETAHRAQLVLAEANRATYGGGSPGANDLAQRAADTFRAIDAEAIPRGSALGASARAGRGLLRGRAPAIVWLAVILVAIVVRASLADDATERARFARGASHYAAGDFGAAMREFRDIVDRVPRAADAWANLGTAAWYAEDTATAAIGWQRALRLEPLALDVRGRLEATPGFRSGVLGDVPPIPVDGASALGVLLWLGGWGTLAGGMLTRRTAARRPALAAVAGGAVVGLATLALAELQGGRGQVIVLEATQLRSAPALGADASGEALRAESARQVGAQGVWSRLRFADGRRGWVETRRLASLDLSRAP